MVKKTVCCVRGFGTEGVREATGTLHQPACYKAGILCLNLNLLFHCRTDHEGPEAE